MDVTPLLERSSREHSHLCPRQVLGVRIGLAGLKALGFREPPPKRQMLAICETDGCFVDGITAATECTVGHRSLRIADYGKIAATFVDVRSERAVRVAPVGDARQRAGIFLPEEPRTYFAQLKAYQLMPDEELLVFQDIELNTPVSQILARPGARLSCDSCGEEIINERQVTQDGSTLCRACAGYAYYQILCPEPALPVEA